MQVLRGGIFFPDRHIYHDFFLNGINLESSFQPRHLHVALINVGEISFEIEHKKNQPVFFSF